jgi:hypothetical protein
MDGVLGRYVRTALVVLMESLRRLEFGYSIIAFSQRADLIKWLDAEVDDVLGEAIIESFTFSDGTNLYHGLDEAVKKGFVRKDGKATEKPWFRTIMTLTDGFVTSSSDERDKFAQLLQVEAREINFCFLAILP